MTLKIAVLNQQLSINNVLGTNDDDDRCHGDDDDDHEENDNACENCEMTDGGGNDCYGGDVDNVYVDGDNEVGASKTDDA